MVDITIAAYKDLPVKSELIAWSQFMELTGLHPLLVGELIDMGWLAPLRTVSQGYLFRVGDIYRVRKLSRLCQDLDISLSGASIIVDLVERVERLEKRVKELERLI
jgi:chaperone modulatory protein CbpM